jgi:NAD(P)-dependent dehydrogenase (short-subunit alcohol dehydrogenase family)
VERLEGRVAVVTGGGGGIGQALALACADAGMDVAVADIESDKAESVADVIRSRGRKAFGVRSDVSDFEDVQELCERSWKDLGGCHLLCNNAGVLVMGQVHERPLEDWEWLFGVNVHGMVHGVKAFVPRMIEDGDGGHVLNTCSINGLVSIPANGIYSASKYAALGLTEAMRLELEPHGIGVTALCPSGVRTGIMHADRNRPEELGKSGAIEKNDAIMVGSFGNDANRTPITPERAAEVALDAVRRNELYAITHPGTKEMIQARFDAILAACDATRERFPDLP